VYDGNPPRVIDPDDEDDGDADAKVPASAGGSSSGPAQTKPPSQPADAKPGETGK